MIDLFTGNANELTLKEKKELAIAFSGLSGADIEDIITKALRNAVIYNSNFNIRNIYEELFAFKNILPQNCNDDKISLQFKAKFLRDCNEKIFSLQIIADILGSSKTTIQKLVKEVNE